MAREIVRVCDLKPGDIISGTDETEAYALVVGVDGPNLTIGCGDKTVTMHMVDYMDKIARYV